jgi:ATP-dependent DNA helicase RecQ
MYPDASIPETTARQFAPGRPARTVERMNTPPLQHDLLQTLQTHFGFDRFLPGQQPVIECLLAGKSAAAVFPTGGGKSLCYQLPALLLPGVTLVVSPLIALMKDQIDALARRGIAAARLDSTLSADEYAEAMQQVRAGTLRLLYVAPERFQNERFRQLITQLRIALFAVDEAHCISEWGHNFRPDYLKLVEFARQCRAERLLALTATATPQVLRDICQAFAIDRDCAVRNSCYRANLTLLTATVDPEEHESRLLERLRQRPRGPTIVYVTLQRTAEQLAEQIAAQGCAARAYHAGMEDVERTAVQDWFMHSTDAIVVATIAFGMGIDKADIRYVYHYNPPKSLENYAQEVGRAGRDGLPATCEMLFCWDDLNQLENFAYGDTPTRAAIDRLVRHVFDRGEEFDLNYYELSGQCDVRPLVARTLITYLELDGFLEGGTPFYATYRFQPLRPSREIIAEFDADRGQFLERLFRQVTKAKTWFSIDVDCAAQALNEPRERIVRAIDYLGERGWLRVEAAGVRHRFRKLRTPADLSQLAQSLHARSLDRQRQEIARLDQVVQFAQPSECQVTTLCGHFGEARTEPCGHCTTCLDGAGIASSRARTAPPLNEAILAEAVAMQRENRELLADPVAMTRWLCGITSPALTKSKLSSHPLFGALADQPFSQLLARLEREMQSSK